MSKYPPTHYLVYCVTTLKIQLQTCIASLVRWESTYGKLKCGQVLVVTVKGNI